MASPSFIEKVFVLGPATNGEEAAQRCVLFPGAELIFCKSNSEALVAPLKEKDSAAIVPVYNTIAGVVDDVVRDFWLECLNGDDRPGLYSIGEILLKIDHCLVVRDPETSISEVKRVISHPQALQQCRRFIIRHNLECIPALSTSKAAGSVVQDNSGDLAAISTRFAAQKFGLTVLKADIANSSNNYTYFHAFGREMEKDVSKSDRTAFVFVLKNEPGALLKVISLISKKNVNIHVVLTLLLGSEEECAFYCEVDCHQDDKRGLKIFGALPSLVKRFIILGSYRRYVERRYGWQ